MYSPRKRALPAPPPVRFPKRKPLFLRRTHHLLRGASKRRVWESRSTYDKAGVERESAGVGERAGCISYPPNLADASMQVGQRMPAFDAGAMDKVPSSGGIQK